MWVGTSCRREDLILFVLRSLEAFLQYCATPAFDDVEEETKNLPWTWPGTPEEVWEQAQAVAVPFRPMLDRVPAAMWPRINQEVLAAIQQYVRGEEIEFGVSVVLATGSK